MEIEELEELLADTQSFTSKIFDYVRSLERIDFLGQIYSFQGSIEEKIEKLKSETKKNEEAEE